jgi:hypothetical protein
MRNPYLFPFEHRLLRPRASGRRVPSLLYGSVEEDLSLANERERIPTCRIVQINSRPLWEKRCHTQPPSEFDAEEGLDAEGMLKASTNMDEWGQEEEEDPQSELDITSDDREYEVPGSCSIFDFDLGYLPPNHYEQIHSLFAAATEDSRGSRFLDILNMNFKRSHETGMLG